MLGEALVPVGVEVLQQLVGVDVAGSVVIGEDKQQVLHKGHPAFDNRVLAAFMALQVLPRPQLRGRGNGLIPRVRLQLLRVSTV